MYGRTHWAKAIAMALLCLYSPIFAQNTASDTLNTLTNGSEIKELTGRNFKNRGNLLTWKMTPETTKKYFVVERSEDGKVYRQVFKMRNGVKTLAEKGEDDAEIDNASARNKEHTYEFLDIEPESGLNYYRLSQVDSVGNVQFLGNVHIKPKEVKMTMSVSPNPSRDIFRLSVGAVNVANNQMKGAILDLSGKVVKNVEISTEITQIDLSDQPAGVYFIRIDDGKNNLVTQRIVKLD